MNGQLRKILDEYLMIYIRGLNFLSSLRIVKIFKMLTALSAQKLFDRRINQSHYLHVEFLSVSGIARRTDTALYSFES